MRYAKRLADRLHAPWTALYVETREALQLSDEQRDRHRRHPAARRTARRRGASPFRAATRRIADDIIAYAQANNVTHIVIGKSTRSRWFEIFHGSVVHDLVRKCRQYQRSCHRWRRASSASRFPRRRSQRGSELSRSTSCLIVVALASVAVRARRRPSVQPFFGIRERRSRVPDGRRRRCGALRPLALAGRRVAASLCLQFLFPAAALHLHDRGSDQRCGTRLLHDRGGAGLQPCGTRARAGRRRSGSARDHRSALSLSAASSPEPARSTMCCGQPHSRSPRC